MVREAVETNCEKIVFEELSGIRERLPYAKWHNVWAFRRLTEYVSYKPPDRGVTVNKVGPQHTSQRCSKCGFTAKANRDGTEFHCHSCGRSKDRERSFVMTRDASRLSNHYQVNADYNASKNIGLRYARQQHHQLRSGQKFPSGDAPVSVHVTRGTVTDDGPQALAAD